MDDSSFEHVCAACPKAVGKSCCEVDGEHDLATLTGGDIARIAAETGLAPRAFVTEERFDEASAHAYEGLRPANQGAIREGVRRHLKARGGACVFHRKQGGCTLSAEGRPLACRLYPFEVNALGKVAVQASGRCHALEREAEPAGLFRALGTSRRQVLKLHRRLLEELAQTLEP